MGCPSLSMALPVSLLNTLIDVGYPRAARPNIGLADQVPMYGITQRWLKKFDVGIRGRQATAGYAHRAADAQTMPLFVKATSA